MVCPSQSPKAELVGRASGQAMRHSRRYPGEKRGCDEAYCSLVSNVHCSRPLEGKYPGEWPTYRQMRKDELTSLFPPKQVHSSCLCTSRPDLYRRSMNVLTPNRDRKSIKAQIIVGSALGKSHGRTDFRVAKPRPQFGFDITFGLACLQLALGFPQDWGHRESSR